MKLNIIQRENKYLAIHEGQEYEINVSLIKTDKGVVVVSTTERPKENTNTFDEGFNGDWYCNSKYNTIARIGDITEFDFKIITTDQSISLEGVPQVLFKEDDINEKALRNDGYTWHFINGFKQGIAQSQSTHPFTEDDMKAAIDYGFRMSNNIVNSLKYFKDRNNFIQSLKQPKIVAVEVEEQIPVEPLDWVNTPTPTSKPKLSNGNIIVNKYYYK